MNENPDRTSWDGVPPGRLPALSTNGGGAVWQPASGYPEGDSGYQQAGSDNLVQTAQKYFWILFRHRWVVLGIVVAFLSIGFIFTFLSTPIYSATTTIQIDREPAKVVNLGEIQGDFGSYQDYDSFYATQYEILKSRSLAEQIASTFSVDELQKFTEHSVLSPVAKLRQIIGRLVRPRNTAAAEDEIDVLALQMKAASRVQGGLSVQPVGTSRIVRLTFESPDPGWAQRAVNAVASTFVALTLQRRFEASSYARNFLEERLKEVKVKLEDSEVELVAYAQSQKIVNVDERKSLVSASLDALNAELATTSRQRLKAELLLQQADKSNGLALPQIMNDESIRRMRERRTEFSTEYQNKLSFFKPDYPDMLNLSAQIAEIDRQIKETVDIVKQSLKAEYEAARSQQDDLIKQLEALKEEALDLDSRGIQYRILQREVDTNRQLYDGLLQQFKEVGVAGAVSTNNVSIVDSADLPGGPVRPRLSKNLTLALVLGLFCGGIAALGLEYLDDTFKVPEDLEAQLGLPVLGVIPISLSADAFTKAINDPRSPVSEAYRSLRTALQFSTADGAPRTLLLTSARAGEGKSTTATALAKNFARLGLNILLVDADLRNPSLHKTLGAQATEGLSNYLTGSSLPQGVFQQTDQEGLTFMASGPLPPNPAELLAGPKMPSLLHIAAEKFDLVIVDGPPVLGLADAPLLASVTAGTLLVVEAGRTRRKVTKAALKRLHFARAQMVGTLLSKFNARDVGHTYGYGYGYGDTSYYGYGSDPTPMQLEQDPV